jgi:hypothetical protein
MRIYSSENILSLSLSFSSLPMLFLSLRFWTNIWRRERDGKYERKGRRKRRKKILAFIDLSLFKHNE